MYALGEEGRISGRVVDRKTGEPLIGANVIVKGSAHGSASDLDGYYFISGLPLGSCQLVVRYMGYETAEIEDIVIRGNNIEHVNIMLTPAVMRLNEVLVEGSANVNSDLYVLLEQKKSNKIQDGISSEQMSRSGDGNAADAAKRITGLSVQEGKYISIRGLNDRYVSTEMNGAPVPSPEPEKKSVPLDLFTTGILESIVAYKTFTPDLPGNFGAGTVNIKTKAYPDVRVIHVKFGLAGKSALYHANFINTSRGTLDYFGFDDGSRSIPDMIPRDRILTEWATPPGYSYSQWKEQLGEYGRSFRTDYCFQPISPGQAISLSANYGNRYRTNSGMEYGFYSNVNFSNSYGYREEQYRRYAVSQSGMIVNTDINNQKSTYNTNLSVSGSTGLKWNERHKFKLYGLYTHNSESSLTFGNGRTQNIDDNGIYIREYFVEKSILNGTATGEHAFDDKLNSRLEWALNGGISSLNEPDVKSHNYRYITSGSHYEIERSSAKAGQRAFTWGNDRNVNTDINYRTSVHDKWRDIYVFKAGGRFQYKNRDFSKRIFYHEHSGGPWPLELVRVQDNAFGSVFNTANFLQEGNDAGLIILEAADMAARNAYRADEWILAAYAMMDVPLGFGQIDYLNKIRFVGGLRYEYYDLNLIPYNPVTRTRYSSPLINNGLTPVEANIKEHELLPGLNFQYDINSLMKLRLSYSKTVARPEFREIAPFEFQQFYGGSAIVGYPFLETTDIYNYDLRYEWYYGPGEMFALSVFHKNLINPIEISQIETADESYLTYQNALYARIQGLEFDFRNRLPFFNAESGNLMLMFNCMLSLSEVETNEMITLFNGVRIRNNSTTLKRPLQGQSNLSTNVTLAYNDHGGWSGALTYHVFSKRLYALGSGSVPNTYEMPFHSLNMTLSKKFKNFKIDLKADNILNAKVRFGIFDHHGLFYPSNEYKPGIGYSINMQYVF
ncbi:MAG: carboxypeptidase-like regulatory domain-containing protein [FCB group bacterium]|nr:carboxypeptidase-like regulatory domain-containing protein [FCB group bacterium]